MTVKDYLPLSSHLDDLKKSLLQIVAILLLATLATFTVSDVLISVLSRPLKTEYQDSLIEYKRMYNNASSPRVISLKNNDTVIESDKVVITGREVLMEPTGYIELKVIKEPALSLFSPAEGLILSLKLSFWTGFVLSSPLWLYSLIKFISPALYPEEKKLLFPFLLLSFLFMGLGSLFAYFLTLPLTNSYFLSFNEGIGTNLWGLGAYLDYAITLIAAHALGFEGFVIVLFLIQMDFISYEFLKGKRRHAAVLSLVIGALLTPPDILSQIMLAVPLMGLYELAVLFAIWRRARKPNRSYRADLTTHASR